MTISSTTNRVSATGNGVTTSFSFPYYVIAAADLKVYQAGTLKTNTTHYTLSGSAPYTSGTNVQFVTAPANGDSVVIIRDPALTQSVDLVDNDPFDPDDAVETPLDRLTMIAQRMDDRIDRAAQLSDTDTSGADVTLPTPSASKLLGWNSSATGLTNYASTALTATIVPTAFAETLLDDASAAVARNTLLIDSKSTVASATTPDIWTTTGHLIDYTGTATATGFAAAPYAGASRELLCAGAAVFTAGTNLVVAGTASGSSLTCAAGDRLLVTAETTTKFRVFRLRADGYAPLFQTPTIPGLLQNISIASSFVASTLQVDLFGASGAAISTTNPAKISFRSSTIGDGSSSDITLTAAPSTLVISSTSTLGTVSGQYSRIWVAAISYNGAVELAVMNALNGVNWTPIIDGALISTTAEGGAGAADSAGVWYSTTARSNVPFVILGYIESTQATAGTWATSASATVVNPKRRPGDVVQSPVNQSGAVVTGATTVPIDDTIPQSGEGVEMMTQAITPTFAGNLLDIEHHGVYACAAAEDGAAFLLQDSGANALKVSGMTIPSAGHKHTTVINHRMVAGTTSATTFKIRAGFSGNAVTLNGSAGSRLWGGVAEAHLRVNEIFV